MRKPATTKTPPAKPGGRISTLKARLESAVIDTVSWAENTLTVSFHSGAVWAYDEVPIETALMLIADKSPGGFLAKWVKPKYAARKLLEVAKK
jgi:hypothetical protein